MMRHLAILCTLAALGCSGTMTEVMADDFRVKSPSLAGANIDVAASSVKVEAYSESASWFTKEIRQEIADGLAEAMSSSPNGKPARFRLTVVETSSNPTMIFVPCFVVLGLFGCPGPIESARVELELEVDGKVYKETGEGGQVVLAYTMGHKHVATAGSVAEAIQDALRKIDAKAGAAQ